MLGSCACERMHARTPSHTPSRTPAHTLTLTRTPSHPPTRSLWPALAHARAAAAPRLTHSSHTLPHTASGLLSLMPALLRHPDANVRARSANLVGNLCRHRWGMDGFAWGGGGVLGGRVHAGLPRPPPHTHALTPPPRLQRALLRPPGRPGGAASADRAVQGPRQGCAQVCMLCHWQRGWVGRRACVWRGVVGCRVGGLAGVRGGGRGGRWSACSSSMHAPTTHAPPAPPRRLPQRQPVQRPAPSSGPPRCARRREGVLVRACTSPTPPDHTLCPASLPPLPASLPPLLACLLGIAPALAHHRPDPPPLPPSPPLSSGAAEGRGGSHPRKRRHALVCGAGGGSVCARQPACLLGITPPTHPPTHPLLLHPTPHPP